MSTEEKEELFKLEVEQLSLLEGKNVKGGGESGFFCDNDGCDEDSGIICDNNGC
ncbi:hypothetical protein NXY26_21395 [Parabacteroides distasonis]|nr:hypothetical protein NXY26_21395 [Parabacteroides distasonis]